jgi:predicted DNA-binding ribbon-helix-helix protein
MSRLPGKAVPTVWKRSIVIAGHNTSVSLEDEFWKSLKEIASECGMTLAGLVSAIDANRNDANLSSALRLFVLGVYQDRTRETLCYLGRVLINAQLRRSFEAIDVNASAAAYGRSPMFVMQALYT